MKNIFKIIFVIIGTIVGAGFASGKEIYSFFFIYGYAGIIGIIISCLVISFIIFKTLKICEKYKVKSYKDFCDSIESSVCKNNNNYIFSKLFNWLINIFLLIMFYVMISGFSSFLFQEFGLNKLIGSMIIIILCFFTFKGNIDKLMKISNYLIPFLIIFIIYISSKNVLVCNFKNYIRLNYIINMPEKNYIVCLGKSILYSSYNCIVLIPVLVQLSISADSKNRNKTIISVISFFIFSILSFAIYNLLLQGNYEIFDLDMPVVEITKQFGSVYSAIYILIIGIAIFTSAASSGVRISK